MENKYVKNRPCQFSRRRFLKMAATAAAVPVLTSCLPKMASSPAAPVAAPDSLSQVVLGYGIALATLDPHKNGVIAQESVIRNIYEALVAASADLKTVEPQLATEWKHIDDLTMQFKLRQNVKFHNGEEFDAEAVKASFTRVLNPDTNAPMLGNYSIIDRVDVLDKHTVNIVTKKPDPVLLRRLSGMHTNIMAPKYITTAPADEIATKPSGTGPYRLVSWVKDGDLVMEANLDYWGPAPKIGKVIVRSIPEVGTRISALMAGDVDVIAAVPPDDVERINQSGKARVLTVQGNRIMYWAMGVASPPTNNKLVRQAINYAANIDGIIKTVLRGSGYRRATLINPWHTGYSSEVQPYPYDPEKAKALLAEAGYPNGCDVNMNLVAGRVVKDKEVGEAIAGELAKVGINAKITWHEFGNYVSLASAGKLDGIIFASWGNVMQDADQAMMGLFHSSSGVAKAYQNGYSNPELDAILEQARSELNQAKRVELYTQAQRILLDDAPGIFGYSIEDIYAVNNRIEWQPRSDEMVWFQEMSPKS